MKNVIAIVFTGVICLTIGSFTACQPSGEAATAKTLTQRVETLEEITRANSLAIGTLGNVLKGIVRQHEEDKAAKQADEK